MPQIAKFPSNLTGAELLAMLRELRPDVTDADESLIRNFGLGLELSKKLNELSGGTRQKINAVAAFMFNPALMILDEPTAGLDPIGAAAFDELIEGLQKKLDLTVFLITHDLDTLWAICDRVAVIADKKVIAVGTIEELLALDHPCIQEYFNGPRGRAAVAGLKRQ
jgi:phospholipid/cholesterol/gamma-HCH transport system ATP-binding protein